MYFKYLEKVSLSIGGSIQKPKIVHKPKNEVNKANIYKVDSLINKKPPLHKSINKKQAKMCEITWKTVGNLNLLIENSAAIQFKLSMK